MHARFTWTLTILVLAAVSPALAQEPKKVPAELQGTWKLMSVEAGGEAVEFPANLPRWVIKADQVVYGREPLARLTVNPESSPRSMDLHFVESKRDLEAIYAIDGDTLKICVNKR